MLGFLQFERLLRADSFANEHFEQSTVPSHALALAAVSDH